MKKHKISLILNLFSIFIFIIPHLNIDAQNFRSDSIHFSRLNDTIDVLMKRGDFLDNISMLKNELSNYSYSPSFRPKVYILISSNFGMARQIDSSLYYTELAINALNKLNTRNYDYYKALNNLRNITIYKGNRERALEISYELLDYFENVDISSYIDNKVTTAYLLINLRIFDDAYNHLKEAEAISYKHSKPNISLWRIHEHLASLEYYKNFRIVNEKVLHHSKMSLDNILLAGREMDIANCKNNYGNYLLYAGKYKEGLNYLMEANEFFESKNIAQSSNYFSLAMAWHQSGDYQKTNEFLEKIDPARLNITSKLEYDILLESVKAEKPYHSYFRRYRTILDSINQREIEVQIQSWDKKYNNLQLKERLSKAKEDSLHQQLLVNELNIEKITQETALQNAVILNTKLDNELLIKSISEKEKQLEIETVEAELKITNQRITMQKRMIGGSLVGGATLLFLTLLLFRQDKKQKVLIKDLHNSKDQIQTLNRELNHRVKNNLAFMSSLLEMQTRRIDSPEAKKVLEESENRLRALALVHSQLFNNEDDVTVNLKDYIQELTNSLHQIFSISEREIRFSLSLVDYHMNAEDAMRLGLIINEAVTNSVKHAFSNVPDAQITIESKIDAKGKLNLMYKDNGPGEFAPKPHINNSLGLKLIELLKKQLGEKYVFVMSY